MTSVRVLLSISLAIAFSACTGTGPSEPSQTNPSNGARASVGAGCAVAIEARGVEPRASCR